MTADRTTTRTRALVVALLGALLLTSSVAASLEAAPKKKKKKNRVSLASQFDSRTLASGFNKPISFDFLPNGKILVAEKAGRLYIVNPDGASSLLLDISNNIVTDRERGLEGVEVASDFATSRRVYLIYAARVNPLRPSGPQSLRVSYITLNSNDTLANPASPETIVLGKDATGACPPITNKRDCPASIDATHQGGTVLSAPDGTLWVGFGDSNLPDTPGNQVFRTFNPASTAGKILHFDAEGNGLRKHPFCKKTKDLSRTCTKVHARGFRNPFRFVLTPGGKPLVGDVGWNLREEVDLVKKGGNYGWPCFEGSAQTPFYRDLRRCRAAYNRPRKFSKPIYEYRNNRKLGGAAVIVGPQYPGGAYPRALKGAYFFGDYASRFIKEAVLRKGTLKGIRTVATGVFPVQLRLAPSGNMSYVDFIEGAVKELVFSANKAPTAVAAGSPTSGPTPLNVGFSSAGSSDPEGSALTYFWDFGDGGTSTAPNPSHTYVTDGTYTAKLTVSDGQASSTAIVRVYAGNSAPSGFVQAPADGSLFRVGAPVTLQASGSDPEDGPLPSSAFSWDIFLIHKDHRHVLGTVVGSPTQFQAVTDHDADSHYAITPSITDSEGLTVTLPKVNIFPEAVRLRIKSKPGKIKLSYGGRGVKTPEKLNAAIGFNANLSAPARVIRGGRSFRFAGWSQRGPRNQVFTVPAENTTIVARYKPGG